MNNIRSVHLRFLSVPVIFLLLISCMTPPTTTEESSDRPDMAGSYMEEGKSHTEDWNLQMARESFSNALREYSKLDNREGTVQALLSLGWNSWQNGEPASTLEYYHHASELAVSSNDDSLILDTRNHQADLAYRLGDPVKAVSLLEDYRLPGGGRVEAARLRIYGTALDSLGESDKAVDLLKEAVRLTDSVGEYNEKAQSAYRIASILSRQALFEEALFWATEALNADKLVEYAPGVAADLRALAIIAAKSGNDAAAADYYRRAWLAYSGLGRQSDADAALRELETLTGRKSFLPQQ